MRPSLTAAATSNTINFQARLETSAGAIVPDGTYNVEFKLYSVATLGSTEWTEDYTYNSGPGAADARIRVVNGYLTANLGSITAFPGTINWNQQQWLTMNIGGTVGSGTITWDGEMSPRLQLTAVPYAFQAGTLSSTSGSNVGTLSFGAVTNPTDTITLPDASGTVCLQNASACGFATGSGAAFLQGGNSFGAQGVLGTNDNNSLTLETDGNSRLTLDNTGAFLTFLQASTINVVQAGTALGLTIRGGAATSGANVGGNLLLQGGAGASTGASGSVIVKANTNDTTTAFQVQNAGGTATVLDVDTVNDRVGIGTNAPSATLNILDTLFSDNFNRANSSSLGASWTTVVDAGSDFQIVSNQLKMTSSDNSNNALGVYTTQGISGADYSVQSDISVSAGTNWVSVFGRGSTSGVNDTQGYYLFAAYVGGANRLYLYKRVTGTWTQLASANETFATGTTYTLRLVMQGSNLYGYLNGALAVSATDSTFTAAGFAGVGVGNPNTTNISWDNFAITSLTPSFNLNGNTVLNSNGWLGIDNTNPQYALDVNGSGNFTTSALTPRLDTASGMALTVGNTNAWSINLGNTASNILTTINGTALVKPTGGNDSTSAFQVQNAAGTTTLLNADTTNLKVTVAGDIVNTFSSGLGLTQVSSTTTFATNPMWVAVQGKYAYVVEVGGTASLEILDITNPSSPARVSTKTLAFTGPNQIQVQGHYVYIAEQGSSNAGGLEILDVSNPSSPVSTTMVPVANGGPFGVYVSGRYAYLVDSATNDMAIVDISNPAVPTLVSDTAVNTSPRKVYVVGNYAYVASFGGTPKLQILNVSNPASPSIVGTLNLSSNGDDVSVQGKYAYVTEYNAGTPQLEVVNVSNPASPTSIVTPSSGAYEYDNIVSGRYLFTDGYNFANSMAIVDVSTPSSPSVLQTYTTGLNEPAGMALSGRYLFVANKINNNLLIFDISGLETTAATIHSLEAGSLTVDTNANVGGDVSIQGGVSVGGAAQVDGALGVNGAVAFANSTNSTAAFQVQNASGTALLTGDTVNGIVSVQGSLNENSSSGSGSINSFTDTALNMSGASLLNLSVANANTAAGVAVNGLTITAAAPATPSSGTNTTNFLNLASPVVVLGATVTQTLNGLNLSSPGALTASAASSTIDWNGANITSPSATVGNATATINSNGLNITNGNLAESTGVGSVTSNGINITTGSVGGSAAAVAYAPLAQSSATTTLAVPFSSTQPTAGNKIVLAFWTYDGTTMPSIVSVKDNAISQNTYSLAQSGSHSFSGSQQGLWLYYLDLPSSATWSGNYTITVTISGSVYSLDAGAGAYTGLASGAPTATNSNNGSGTTATSGSISPSGTGLYAAALNNDGPNPPGVLTIASPFTDEVVNNTSGCCSEVGAFADAINTSGSQNATWTEDNTTWNADVVFWPSTGGPGLVENGININASGVAGGTLNGIKISGITAGNGTQVALSIGSGWNTQIQGSGFSVNGTGATAITTTGTTAFQVQNAGGNSLFTVDTSGNNVNIATAALSGTVTIGNGTGASTVTLSAGTGGVNIGTNGVANTIQIGNTSGAVTQTINIGTNNTASSTSNVTLGSVVAGSVKLQGSGITETLTANGDTLKTSSNSTTAFQVQNSSSNQVFAVDTTNNQAVLGKASTLGGQLLFNTASGASTVTLGVGATSSSYSILLPTAGGSASQCLQLGGGGGFQLQWGACGTASTGLAKNAADSSSASVSASSFLYSFTNSNTSVSGGVLSLSNGSNTGPALQASGSGSNVLEVQNASNVNILSVDAGNLRVNLGAGSTGEATPSLLVLDSETGSSSDPTEVNGALYYNVTDNSFRCGENGVWRSCLGGLVNASTAASSAVSGDTLLHNFSGGTNTSYTVLANDCQAGATYLITASGTWTATSTTPTITLYLDEDGTTTNLLTMPSAQALATASTTAGWQLSAQMICDSTTTVEVQGTVIVGRNAGSTTVAENLSNTGTLAWTTSAHTLYTGVKFSSTTGAPSATMRQFIVQRLGP